MNADYGKDSEVVHLDTGSGGGSDLTLKREITNLGTGLDEILALRPVSWQWRNPELASSEETSVGNGDVQYGFLAQEVERILPQLVKERAWQDSTMRKFLTPAGLIPYLVLAIQEQQSQIEALQQRLQSHDIS